MQKWTAHTDAWECHDEAGTAVSVDLHSTNLQSRWPPSNRMSNASHKPRTHAESWRPKGSAVYATHECSASPAPRSEGFQPAAKDFQARPVGQAMTPSHAALSRESGVEQRLCADTRRRPSYPGTAPRGFSSLLGKGSPERRARYWHDCAHAHADTLDRHCSFAPALITDRPHSMLRLFCAQCCHLESPPGSLSFPRVPASMHGCRSPLLLLPRC